MRYTPMLLVLALLVGVVPAHAQEERPVNFTIGGGYTFVGGEVRDSLGDGYNFSLGLTFNLNPVIGIEALYNFNGLGEKQLSLPVFPQPLENGGGVPSDFFATMNMQFFTTNLVIRPQTQGSVKPYLVTGGGVYYRPVEVTTPSVGYVPGYCDPYWYVCYSGGWVETDRIIGERSSTDFGMNVGGGVNFQVSEGVGLFVEMRYHYIWGPELQPQVGVNPLNTSTTGEARKANGQFLPFTFGLRF